jgi:hypothetical protein
MAILAKIIAGSGYPRPIAGFEKDYIIKGIESLGNNGSPIPVELEDGKAGIFWLDNDEFINQLDSLIIIGKCQCGDPECHTVQFQHYRAGYSIKLVEMILEDGRIMRIFINRELGLVSGLEIIRE